MGENNYGVTITIENPRCIRQRLIGIEKNTSLDFPPENIGNRVFIFIGGVPEISQDEQHITIRNPALIKTRTIRQGLGKPWPSGRIRFSALDEHRGSKLLAVVMHG